MKRSKETFHGFEVEAWKCLTCHEVIFDEEAIQPILRYNKAKNLSVKVGVLGRSKMFRIPKVVEELYGIHRGAQLHLGLEPKRIVIEMGR